MLWTKKGDKKSGVQPIDPIPPVASDPALDATGAILRILGKYAFDLDRSGPKPSVNSTNSGRGIF